MLVLRYLLITVICAFVFPVCSFGQVEEKEGDSAEEELFFCRNKDYLFELEGNFYLDNKKAYVCTDNIVNSMSTVRIVRVEDNMPVGSDFIWEINGVTSNHTTNNFVLQDEFNNREKMKIDVEFTDNGAQEKITLRLRRNSVQFRESLGRFSFDENEIEEYRGINYMRDEPLGTPWNFILINEIPLNLSETLEGKIKFKNGVNSVNSITSDSDDLVIDPDMFNSREQNINFTHDVNNVLDDYEIEVSCCNGPDLLLYAGRPKTFDIILYQVCESDDDVQVIPKDEGGGANDPNAICIRSGPDGSIDEMNKAGFLGGDDMLDQDDNGFYIVRTGINGICDTEILDRGTLDARITCPNMIDPQTAVNEMNDLLRKLGVVADVNIQVMPLLVNYDVIKDDGILQVNNTINGSPEILAFQHKRHILDGTPPSNMGPVRAYIIPELNASFTQGDLEGIAYAGFGMHNLMLNDKKADGAILLHETGHAKWSFFHPGDMNPINNRPEVDDDKMNFMYFNSAGRTNNFRRYQFNLIRQ